MPSTLGQDTLLRAFVSSERIAFNNKDNDYRLMVAVDFEKPVVRIKRLGEQAYDRIDALEVKHGKGA